MARFARFACAAMVLALSAPAWAAPSKADEARAATLKKEGDVLMHASKIPEALKKWDESFALVPNPAIFYNRGRALQQMGDFLGALDALDQFVATATPDLKAKVPNIEKTIEEIAAHVATVVIHCEVPGASVTLRGKPIGTTPLKALRTTPGDATITVTAPGYVVFTQESPLPAGESTTIDVTLHKGASADQIGANGREPTPFDAEPKPGTTPVAARASGHNGWRTLTWFSGGVGVATLGTGLVFFGISLADKGSADAHCPNKVCDAMGRQSIREAWTFADVSTVLVVTGAVALALSLTSFIVTPKRSAVQARLFVGPAAAGIGGSF